MRREQVDFSIESGLIAPLRNARGEIADLPALATLSSFVCSAFLSRLALRQLTVIDFHDF